MFFRSCSGMVALVACLVLAAGSSARAELVFSENFNGQEVGNKSHSDFSDAGPAYTFGAASSIPADSSFSVNEDAGDVFGEGTSNKFLRAVDGGPNPRISGAAPLDNTAFEWSFQFYHAWTDAETNGWLNFGLAGDANPASARIVELQFQTIPGDPFSGPHIKLRGDANDSKAIAFNVQQTYDILVVGNATASPYQYAGGSQEVSSRHYDIWVDGVLVAEEVHMVGDGLPSSQGGSDGAVSTISHIGIYGGSNGTEGDIWFDNVTINTVPEPSTALLAISALAAVPFMRRRRS